MTDLSALSLDELLGDGGLGSMYRDSKRRAEILRRFAVLEQEKAELVRGMYHTGVNLNNALIERDAAERDRDRLRGSLEKIDSALTTVEGDNVPRGESPKQHARKIARAALSEGGTDA